MNMKIRNRILAMVLAVVMVFGMMEGFAVAAENTATTITMTSEDFSLHLQSSKKDALATRIYLKVSDDGKTKATPIKNYVLSAKDDNSGIYLGETKTQTTMKFQNDGNWIIGANFKDAEGTTTTPEQGTIVTVKGTFTTTVGEQVYELVVPEMKFRYVSNGTVGWEVYVPPVTLDMSTATFTVNGNSNNYLLYLNGKNYPDISAIKGNSNAHFYASETDAGSGIWLGDTKIYSKILIQSSGLMQIGGFCSMEDKTTRVYATEGEVLTIKGTFTVTLSGQLYEMLMPEMQFQYTSEGWVVYEEPTNTTITMTAEDFTLHLQSSKKDALATRIYLKVSDDGKTKATPIQNYVLSAKDDNSGIYIGEVKTQTTMKFQNDGNWIIGANFKDAEGTTTTPEQGTIVTVKGTFTTTVGEQVYELVVPEMKFRYVSDGTVGWEIYEESTSATITMTAEDFTLHLQSSKVDALATRIYLKVSDDGKTKATPIQNYVLSAKDDNSGIYIGETKTQTTMKFQNDGNWIIGANFKDAEGATITPVQDDTVTIKGTFTTTVGEQVYELVMPEMKFQYTGAGWVVYAGEVTYTDITLEKLYPYQAPRVHANGQYWEFYVLPVDSKNVDLGDTWNGNGFRAIKVKIGNAEPFTVDATYAGKTTGLYFKIPIEKLPSTITGETTVVIQSGKYVHTKDATKGINLTEDFTLYVNENGWSSTGYVKEVVYTDVTLTRLHSGVLPVVNAKGNWAFYVMPDVTGLGEPWIDKYNAVKMQVGDQAYSTTLTVANKNDGLYFTIPTSVLPEVLDSDIAITIKAGEYISLGNPEKGIRLKQDFTIYANKYGFSTTKFMREIQPSQTGAVVTLDRDTNYGGNENGLYLKTNDIFPVDKEWKTRIRAISYDDNSGIFYNGVKLSNADIARYANGKLYLSLARGGVEAKDKDKVTIKGIFALGETGVSYKEVSFYYNGKIWCEGTYEAAKPETYTKIQGVSIHSVTNFNQKTNKWVFYVNVDNMLPGEIDKIKFENLTVVVDGQEIETRVSHSHQHTLCFSVSGDYLPENVKDGVKVTIKAGKALAADKSTGIELTKDFSFYSFRGAWTEQTITKNTAWQELTVSRLYRAIKYSETGKRWSFHLKTRETVECEKGTVFYQLPVEVNGKTCLVQASVDSGMIHVKIPEKNLSGTTQKATIRIKAGAEAVGNGGRNGIRFKEDWTGYIYNGVLSDQEFDKVIETETNILGIQTVGNNATSWGFYLRVNREIPGTDWYEYYDDFVYYYNGRKIQTNLVRPASSNDKYIYFSVNKQEVPEPKEGDLIKIVAGTKANCGGYRITIMNDFMMTYADGVWSAYIETDVTAPEATGTFWENFRFEEGYIPITEDGAVTFAGTDEFNMVSTIESHKDYTMKFRVKKSLADEENAPFRIILRGNAVSDTEEMTPFLLNGYVLTFNPNKITDKETGELLHYGCTMHLWKNGQNDSLKDQYRLSYVKDESEHPYFENDVYYDYEISVYNVTDTCVCIEVKVNGKLAMRYYDEAGSDPFDPAINGGKFCIVAVAPATVQDEIVELGAVISEADECKVGQKIRVAATYPSVLDGVEFTVDSEDAVIRDGLFKAEKAGTYTVSCTYNGKKLEPKVITVVASDSATDVVEDKTFPIIPVIIIAVVVLTAGVAGTVVVIKKKGSQVTE